MKRVICTICLMVFMLSFTALEIEASRTRTRNPRVRDSENKRVIRAKERKKKIEEGRLEIRERQREKQRQAVLKTWDSNLPTPQYDTYEERTQIDDLGPNGKAYWTMARKSEILMDIPKYGTRKRQEYDYKRDLKRFPKMVTIIKKSADYEERYMRMYNRPARSTRQWMVLREWGFPFEAEVLTTKGDWLPWSIVEYKDDDYLEDGKLFATNRERWSYYDNPVSDELAWGTNYGLYNVTEAVYTRLYFENGALTSQRKEKVRNTYSIWPHYW